MNIFGGNTGMSYDDVQRKRKIAQQLMAQQSTPRNVGEGLHAIGRAIAGRAIEKRADRSEKKMRDQFNEQFGQVAPQSQAMVDLYNNPMASDGHKKILGALMKGGVPGFSRGGVSRGGLAVVGEAGPELVELPPMSKVLGPGFDPGYESPNTPSQYNNPPEPDEYMREEMGEEMFRLYESMTPQQRIEFLNDPANGFVPPIPPGGGQNQIDPGNVPMSRFDDANAYQVAQANTGTATDAQPSFSDRAKDAGLDLNVTQAQRSGQALRLLQSESILRDLEQQGTRTFQDALQLLPDRIENHLVDEEYGKFQQARDAFVEAAMRADTGATINKEEWPRIIKNLMPQPGDGPERIAQRRAAREVFIHSLIASSGEASALMPKIGEPVVPIENTDPTTLSDEELLKALGQ